MAEKKPGNILSVVFGTKHSAQGREKISDFARKLAGEPPKEEEKKEEDLVPGKLIKKQRLIIEQMNAAAEATYFWILNYMRKPSIGYTLEKISDVYTATETSSFFGNIEQRKAIQQDRVSTTLATIGGMVKSLFQIIRELTIMDERLNYHKESEKGNEGAMVALKGMWVDLVEGGAENPGSVLGLARRDRAGFVIIPDLFFKVNPKNEKKIDSEMRKLEQEGINKKITEILGRKLFQFYAWKSKNFEELTTRKNLLLSYLRQHYHSIRMYMNWIRPTLRNIAKLQMGEPKGVDLITGFESSQIDLEIIGTKSEYGATIDTGTEIRKFKHRIPCVRVKFKFTTLPEMAFQKEYQHRGAVHAGRAWVDIEGFVATPEQLEEYKKKKENEDMEILSSMDESMKAIEEQLKHYLEEAGEIDKEKEAKKKLEERKPGMTEGILEPFVSVFRGLEDLFGNLSLSSRENADKPSAWYIEQEENAAKAIVAVDTYLIYDIYKKAHSMLSW